MRWICKEDIEECLTEQWRQSAQEALTAIIAAQTPQERKDILKKAASTQVWRDFYNRLPDNLKKKCWYCEAEEIRSDMPVDHFRPKNNVEDEIGHEGYWWLAFDWENYRCACTHCNSRRNFEETQGGKACHFPLVNSSKRAYGPEDNYKQEKPDFLDPFDPDDWKLLWFDNDGKPVAIPNADDGQQRKVKNSIDIFHLHETKIVRKRNQVRINVEKTVKQLKEAEADGNNDLLCQAKLALRKMVRETEMHSRAAIVYLRAYRELASVKEILQLD